MPKPDRLGELLSAWRQRRGYSQLSVSLETGISQRHISFIESGRSQPGRRLLLQLLTALNVPLRDRNLALLAAGYAPLYPEPPWDAPAMASITHAIDLVLRRQEPWPALVLDRYWNVLRVNKAAPRLFGRFIHLADFPPPRNLLHLVFSPRALRPFIENWPEVAASLLDRFQREAIGQVHDETAGRLLARLRRYPGVSTLAAPSGSWQPVIPITFRKGRHRSSWFSLVTTVGAPQFVSAQELRIECMFPTDAAPAPPARVS